MKIVFAKFVFSVLILAASSAPQYPIADDQFVQSNHTELRAAKGKITENRYTELENTGTDYTKSRRNEVDTQTDTEFDNDDNTTVAHDTQTIKLKDLTFADFTNSTVPQLSVVAKLYNIITVPIIKLAATPKVRTVIRNVGTCVVNGVMEIISFYFPAPLIPLIASAAGLVIPFEPVVMLREKMPVASYRRAFKTAVDGFLGTFDQYKYNDDDPYMTQRFNRRFMGTKDTKDSDEEKVE